ncbi:MAG: hypothetical protein RR579_08650, partial [Eubacterium sp.]
IGPVAKAELHARKIPKPTPFFLFDPIFFSFFAKLKTGKVGNDAIVIPHYSLRKSYFKYFS